MEKTRSCVSAGEFSASAGKIKNFFWKARPAGGGVFQRGLTAVFFKLPLSAKTGRLLFLLCFSFSATGNYKVCSITINSADEIKAFRAHLSANHFQFKELVPRVKGAYYKEHDSHWFYQSCKNQQNSPCDILVISGHFGGVFFGKTGYTLPTQILEELSCAGSCGGVLSRAKEVFLFGCNTLAGKKPDTRTYQDYLNVLLEDGMAREMAERVAAARYSPLGPSYKNRMKFVFSGSQNIYGFEMLSPLGPDMAPSLRKYFKSIGGRYGDYRNYMDQKGYLEGKNTFLFRHTSHTSMAQTDTVLDELSRETFARKCLLYNEKAPFAHRTQALRELFETDSALKAFFAIDHFWEKHGDRVLESEERRFFHGLRKNRPLADGFRQAYRELKFLPYIQIGFLNFLRRFNWVDVDFFDRELKRSVLRLIETPDGEAYEAVLLLLSRNHVPPGYLYFSKEDFSKGYVSDLWSLLIFEKLRVDSAGLQSDVYRLCQRLLDSDPVICYQALNTLAHMSPSEETVQNTIPLLRHPDPGIIYYSLRVIGQSKARDHSVHLSVAEFLFHPDPHLREEARDSLGFLKTPYGDIHKMMADTLTRGDKKEAGETLKTFGKLDIQSETAVVPLMEYVNTYPYDGAVARGGVIAFKNTRFVPDFALDHFYSLLESEDGETRIWAAETLAEMPVRDFGVDYRLAVIVRNADVPVKRRILRRLGGRTYFHPLAQEEMVPLLIDGDGRSRQSATAFFRNIENRTEGTKNSMKTFADGNPQIKALIREWEGRDD